MRWLLASTIAVSLSTLGAVAPAPALQPLTLSGFALTSERETSSIGIVMGLVPGVRLPFASRSMTVSTWLPTSRFWTSWVQ